MAARGASFLTVLLTVPLAVRHLGPERFGMWATIGSATALLGFADLGLADGLVNVLTARNAEDDRRGARAAVSSAFFGLVAVAAGLGALFAAVHAAVPWASLLNATSPQAVAEAGPAVAVFAACFLAGLPLGVAARVNLGYQEAHHAVVWGAAGSALSLAGVAAAVALGAGLPWMVLALAGGPVAASAANCLVLFGRRRPWLRPSLGAASGAAGRRLVRVGSLFLVLSVAAAAGYQSDMLVIAHVLGPEHVTDYAVPMRLFLLAPAALALVLTPLWPAHGDAIARGDVAWARTALRRSMTLACAVNVPVAVALVAVGPRLVPAWAGAEVDPPLSLLVGMGLFAALNGLSGPIAMFLNGANVIRFQVVCALTMAASNVVLSVVLVHLVGLPGPIYATVVTQVACILVPAAVFLRRWAGTAGAVAAP